jgi:hypothetical protein
VYRSVAPELLRAPPLDLELMRTAWRTLFDLRHVSSPRRESAHAAATTFARVAATFEAKRSFG